MMCIIWGSFAVWTYGCWIALVTFIFTVLGERIFLGKLIVLL